MYANSQSGIFAENSQFYLALEYRCANMEKVRPAIAAARAAAGKAAEAQCVFAFGGALLRALAGSDFPMQDFTPISGAAGLSAPATQRDLLVWIHGPRADANFDLGLGVHNALRQCCELALEVAGFNYRENRDMTGFIDGTANPQQQEARDAALIPEGTPNAGGSYVLSQKFVHDLAAFNKLSDQEQEKVIGRSKADSTEMDATLKPKDAHIARAEITENGAELKIYRRSFPYGGVAEHGLYFLAFACDQHRFDAILKNMYGVSGDGLHDRLMHFTHSQTGSYWFAPSQETLHGWLR